METITVMGIQIKKSPVSPDYKPEKHCIYLDNGFCTTCSCDKCEGGYLIDEWRESMKQGCFTSGPRECDCVQKARNRKHIRDSGLERLVERCTFETFTVKYRWQETVRQKAQEYLTDRRRSSFFIAGQSGSGKTHICTAICNELMKNGERLKYFQYVRDGTRIKQLIPDPGLYEAETRALIEIPYLYIDDLFKQDITAADIRLVYEIINGRYIAQRPTIISSERSLSYIREIRNGEGEAIAGRIFEACNNGDYCLELSGRDKNIRFYTE